MLNICLNTTFSDGNDVGCLGADYCPPECTCTGTIVRCSHAKLTEIPKGIPAETSELYLDVNEITSIESHRLEHLKSLTRLDLSNNKVSVLPPYVFANLTRLATLIVSYNKLQCVQESAFGGFTQSFPRPLLTKATYHFLILLLNLLVSSFFPPLSFSYPEISIFSLQCSTR